MKKILLASVAFAAFAGSALAADLPSRKEAPVFTAPVSVYNWTGFYVGVDAGVNLSTASTTLGATGYSLNAARGVVGGFAGYNYQFANKFVVGVEGEVNGTFSGAKAIKVATTDTWSDKQGLDSVVRARLGYAIDRALIYVAGGVAFEDLSSKFATSGTTIKANAVGWTIGAGVDYAFSNNWFGRVEYRYTDYGTKNYVGAAIDTFTTVPVRSYESSILVGIAYKFGAPEAVVAKY